jgi:glycosyltransferase involved in cell wall biosynthesis
MKKSIKIFVMCRNNRRELEICIKSITKRTHYPHEIIIVDNDSDDVETIQFLENFENTNIKVYFNRYNLWILGLNPALRLHLHDDDLFYVVTDSDIIVPAPKLGKCWLQAMLYEMESNLVIGKLGLSLDLSYIAKQKEFKNTYQREKSFYNNAQIGENYIAPVDTTLALYRFDYFVTQKPRFYPGHGVLARPYFYCCRTSEKLIAKHLGWRSYLSKENSRSNDISKVICFTFMGAYLDEAFLRRVPYFHQKLYQYMRPLARSFWAIFVIYLQIIWFLRNVPFSLNNLQKSLK